MSWFQKTLGMLCTVLSLGGRSHWRMRTVPLPERAREGCSNSKAQNPTRASRSHIQKSVQVKVARYVLQIRCCLIFHEKLAPLSARGSSSDRDRHGQVRCAFNRASALLHFRQLILRSQTVHTTHSVCQTGVTCHCRKTYEVCYLRDRSLSTTYREKVGVWSCLFTVAKDHASLKCATGVAGTVTMELCTKSC